MSMLIQQTKVQARKAAIEEALASEASNPSLVGKKVTVLARGNKLTGTQIRVRLLLSEEGRKGSPETA